MDPRLGRFASRAEAARASATPGALRWQHEIARAARVLYVRSRREAAGVLVGIWPSAFRGGGIEFEESRPYAPGDDVRAIDWNATARTGTPWVKRFREERSCPVLLALDVSASMDFGSAGRTKAQAAAHAAALLAAGAAAAGDPVGLVAFADRVRLALPPGRGDAHTWRVIHAAAAAAAAPAGATAFAAAADWVRAHARRRSLIVLLSDFRARTPEAPAPFVALAHRHDVVAALVEDAREAALVAAGGLRLVEPEPPARRAALGTGRRRRAAYAAAAAARRTALARKLAEAGIDLVALDTAGDPLRPLLRGFRGRRPRRRLRA